MKIAIYGPGCPRCITTEKIVREALKQLDKNAEVEKITDILQYAKAGVTFMPAVVINDGVKISGKVPSIDEIKTMISSL